MTAVLAPALSPTARPAATMARGAAPLRITRRGRMVIAAFASLPLVAATIAVALLGASGGAIATDARSAGAFDYVTVQAGQSLWGIAEELAPNADTRDVIADITELNQLRSVDVRPGQRLAVPGTYSD